MKKITINIYEHIGSSAAVSSEDGEILFNLLTKSFEQKMEVILDFANIELITSTFLNASIGQLYSGYTSQFLRPHLKVANMDKEDMELLKKVVERAKAYFKDRKGLEKNIKEVLGE